MRQTTEIVGLYQPEDRAQYKLHTHLFEKVFVII